MARFLQALGYMWAFPMTCVGWIFVSLLRARKNVVSLGKVNCVYLYKFTHTAPRWMLARYFTHPLVIGNIAVICIRRNNDVHTNTIVKHAIAHAQQWMTFGVFMPFVMLSMAIFLRLLPNADNFYDNALEIDARRYAKQAVDVPLLKRSVIAFVKGNLTNRRDV